MTNLIAVLKIFQLFLILLAVESIRVSVALNDCTQISVHCTCGTDSITCNSFNRFDELDFSSGFKVSQLTLYSSTKLILNDSLNLNGLEANGTLTLYLANLAAIDFKANPFKYIQGSDLFLYIYDSNVRFVYEGKNLSESCVTLLKNPTAQWLLPKFRNFLLGSGNTYETKTCPIIFRNANLTRFDYDINMENKLNFMPLPPDAGIQLNFASNLVFISGKNVIVNKETLRGEVFAPSLTQIYLTSSASIERLSDDAFDDLPSLSYLSFSIENFDSFIQSSNNLWLRNLNQHVTINLNFTSTYNLSWVSQNSFELNMDVRSSANYSFPDADFCRFVNFPHQHLVFPSIIVDNQIKGCTCTLAYLYKYFSVFYGTSLLPNVMNECRNTFGQFMANCQFEQRIEQCKSETTTVTSTSTSTTSQEPSKTTTTTSNSQMNGISIVLLGLMTLLSLRVNLLSV